MTEYLKIWIIKGKQNTVANLSHQWSYWPTLLKGILPNLEGIGNSIWTVQTEKDKKSTNLFYVVTESSWKLLDNDSIKKTVDQFYLRALMQKNMRMFFSN